MKQTTIATLTALSAAVGKDESILRRLRRNGAWPSDVAIKPPWAEADVQRVQRWLAARDAERCADPGLAEERRRLIRSKIERLRLETAIAEARLVRRDDVERRAVAAVSRCRTALLSLPRHVAGELVAKADPGEVEAILMARLTAIAGQYEHDLYAGDDSAVPSPLLTDDD